MEKDLLKHNGIRIMKHFDGYMDFVNCLNPNERNLSFYYKLDEGLIYSVDYNFFLTKINLLLSKADIYHELLPHESTIVLFLKIDDLLNIKKELYALINNLGYYFTQKRVVNKNKQDVFDADLNKLEDYKGNYVYFYCNKKFEFDEVINYVYHITQKDIFEKKILAKGLVPKFKNVDIEYPEPIYLFIKHDINMFKDFIVKKHIEDIKRIKDKENYYNVDDYVILKINLKAFKHIKIMEDPFYLPFKCYYTYENIPNYAITDIENINYNEIMIN